MTNGNSADLKPSQKWTERHKALTEWENKILADGRHVTTREIACFEDGFEAAREALSVCADGGKGEAVAFGTGKLVVTEGEFDGLPAVAITPAKYSGEIGQSAAREPSIETTWLTGTVLTFPTAEQAKLVADALVNATPQAECAPRETAKQQYDNCSGDDDLKDPVERLRFFCSLAMNGQDWMDVEPFFNALSPRADAEKDAALSDERILELLSKVADENMLQNHADEVIAAGRAILAANKEPQP